MEKILKEFSPIPPFPLESIKLSNPKYSDSFGIFKVSWSEYFLYILGHQKPQVRSFIVLKLGNELFISFFSSGADAFQKPLIYR